MRVLHILNTNKYSGAENVVISIINEMNKLNDIENYYVSPKGPIEKVLEKNKIKYIPIKKISIKEIRRICKLYKPDIIHAHDFRATTITAFAGINSKIKLISHLHSNPSWIKKISFNSIIYLLASIRCSKILLVSESIQNEYKFNKLINKKVDVIANPVDCKKIIEKAKLSSHDKKYDLIFIGRLTGEKNPIRFIEIVGKVKEKLHDIQVAIVGDGNLREECNKKIKELQLNNTIEMLGFLENPYSILKNSKILCMTSKWEGYGLVIIEALTLGKPVIAPSVGGIPKILNSKCGVLYEENKQCIKAIIELLEDEKEYNNKSIESIKRANELNNINDYICGIKNIYEGILK